IIPVRRLTLATVIFLVAVPWTWSEDNLPKPLVTGLKNPWFPAIGPDGRIYVSTIGEWDKDGDGTVVVIQDGKAKPFATGLDDPRGMATWNKWLFVVDKSRVWRIDEQGKAVVFAEARAFPSPPKYLASVAIDEEGTLYVSDAGELGGKGGAIYRIDQKGKVRRMADAEGIKGLKTAAGLAMDGMSNLLTINWGTGELLRIKLADGTADKTADGLSSGESLTWDKYGRLFVSQIRNGRVTVIPRPNSKPIVMASGFRSPTGLCVDATGKFVLVVDSEAGTLTALPINIPGHEIDETPMPLKAEVAFPNLEWAGWKPE